MVDFNPLLKLNSLPLFSQIKPEHIEPALDTLLAENRAVIKQLLDTTAAPDWQWLETLEDIDDRLNKLWSSVSHLNAVVNSPALRSVYQNCLPKLTDYATEVSQNEKLYQRIQALADSPLYQQLNTVQQRIIQNHLRDFKLAGVHLPAQQKQRLVIINQALAKETCRFEENILDATQGWTYHTIDINDLAGLPEHAISAAVEAAQAKQLEGWLFTLEAPSYQAILTYADKRALRELFYTAYVTRASEQGPNAGRWDNSEAMVAILNYRHELAQLLGFSNYAEYSLATKMVKQPQQVIDFLQDLAKRVRVLAEQEWQTLQQFAHAHYQVTELQAWDIAYYSEKLSQHTFAISQEALRPYFPEQSVLSGLFEIVQRLYGIQINEATAAVETWHPQVRFFNLLDAQGSLRGQFYLDLYARPHKRGGAWMDDCRSRRLLPNGELQIPVAYLTCNLTPPTKTQPALFTHDEVITLFHEFGHGLHHMLTQINYAAVSGINGVAWDAVELPSQFMENWCWQKEALKLIARHYANAELLPEAMQDKLLASQQFQSGLQMLRQLEYSLFDFELHLNPPPKDSQAIQQQLDNLRNTISVIKPPAFNRFQHSFSHIFAGGYAAAYYSYKWAEVLASDAFSLFEETGIFNAATGQRFLEIILEQGGAKDALDLFVAFRGREPNIDALLRHSGLATSC